ncbi:MAG: putative MFS-type transporter YhjX [Planctomycetes bacterium ADurb.Bin126]|nr:MAG: putative MFS-type transporter YhjX [Planctomycetes bacterium ADurb.Bin126]HOD82403.1 OFA family MFS transporter [Phycisphaerae bacterium]HQL72344.1 OFA family MFS transporter [Phycisphaerae bacterium]
MSEASLTDTSLAPPENHGWRVTFAGMGINLALGVLYTWSVISKGVPAEWQWTESDKSWPYAIACLIFCLIMVPAGRMQDRIGPRIVATIGGILVGIGMILASFTTTPLGFIMGFGVLAGAGIGFGYASATPPAVKWFPKAKTGLIAGLVVSGFGLASVYIAPLAKWLIGSYGVPVTVLAFGIGFLVVVVGLAQLLKPPPKGFVPQDPAKAETPAATAAPSQTQQKKEDFTPTEMLKTWQFYLLWFMYACGAGAGLMVIAKLAAMAKIQAGIELGFILVAVLAVGNGGGRILAGILSDKIGRKATMCICFILQAGLIALLSQTQSETFLANAFVLAAVSALIGANYGANLSLFPSVTKDFYGLKNFGVNYGLVFTAWGVGGFMLALLAGKVYDQTKTFTFAYYCSIALLLMAAAATFLVKAPRHMEAVPKAVES